ncbi:ferric siderophore transport system periplasmic binding protein [Proteus hauseri ATCC 700826]|uniref:Ferric siderophore transport system periplasmic binding protein n=1 Tax=Proteus hauseri ATCC 700826 TaxID=1354271 RepID=A0AAJ3HVS9_PROHU|nr:energy transducer TonB [Proteus hauseri]OAT50549.1 ferric siderophore transport system periplasmic binding protein [Proteus hauseri ATCC 700826]
MFALSVRQPLNLNYWLIGVAFIYRMLFSELLRSVLVTESAHHITQQQQNTLSVYQVTFSAPQHQSAIIKEEIIEYHSDNLPVIVPVVETGELLQQYKKPEILPKEKPLPQLQPQQTEIKKQRPAKEEQAKPRPLEKADPKSKQLQTQIPATLASFTEYSASSQAGKSRALNENSIGQGESESDYMSLLRKEIERHKRYPPKAKRMLLEGDVVVRLSLTNEGIISTVAVENTSGIPSLDNAAIAAVRRVKPIGPKPDDVNNSLIVTLHFNLR